MYKIWWEKTGYKLKEVSLRDHNENKSPHTSSRLQIEYVVQSLFPLSHLKCPLPQYLWKLV